MRILFVTPLFPYPLVGGGQIRFFNLIKGLAKDHQITLFSFIRKDKEKNFSDKLKPYCRKIKVFERRNAWSVFNLLLCGLSRLPFLAATYWSPDFKRAVEAELAEEKYDLIHLECFYAGASLPEVKTPFLLVDHNLEYQVYRQFADQFKIPFLKPFLYFDVWKMKQMETRLWKRADQVAAVSDDDQKEIGRFLGNRCELVLNGVDFPWFAEYKPKKLSRPTVLFVGNMNWFPNRDGAGFLITEIWKKIKKKIPQAQLRVVGQNPPVKILELAQEGIEFDDRVEDIRDAYSRADVLIVPLRMGGGIKFKVLEAMAAGLPVVSTRIGVEGIGVEEGKHFLGGEKAEELAEATVKLLKNKSLRKKIGRAAQEFIGENYDWGKIVKNLNRAYQGVIHGQN